MPRKHDFFADSMGSLFHERPPGNPPISGGISLVDHWGPPIYPGRYKKECPICLREPMIRPVQIQCRHVLCNPCLQQSMADDVEAAKCPICKAIIEEYRGLGNQRIRRPRDKSVPFNENAPFDDNDPDFVPPTLLTLEVPSGLETESSGDENVGEVPANLRSRPSHVRQQASASVTDQTGPKSQRSVAVQVPSQQSSQESVKIVAEYPPRPERSDERPRPSSAVQRIWDIVGDPRDFYSNQQPRSRHGQTTDSSSRSNQNLTQEIIYELVERVLDYRGRGPNIRYLVVYHDGQQSWEPMSHMKYAWKALDIFRKRLHVINQQNYRKRRRGS